MHSLLNRFFELALSEVHRYEGTINQFLGDGFMGLYGAPVSHEDHARRAVLSAIGLQQKLKEMSLGALYGVECSFRIGINSGLVVVGSIGDNLRMDYSAIGDTTNLASRLQTQSEPGEILVSETTARLVEGYIRLETLEPVKVKGKTESVAIFKVLGTLPRRSPIVSRSERTLRQFVGRERELATLEELYSQVESGNGQIVGIVAEAGQGKSRLLYEFRQRLLDKSVTYLEGRCLSYGGSIPYHSIIDVLRHNCGIGENDSPETIAEKIQLSLQEVGMNAEESAPYLLQVLGLKEGTEPIAMLTTETVRTRTFETLRQMSLNGSQLRPIIFEVEDLHWCDNTSEAYLSELAESLPGTSIMLLTTYRPGYQPLWLGKSYATQISLHSLVPQDALTIVHATTQDQVLPDHLAQTIVEKADGNPFFLEELTRAVIEVGEQQTDVVPDTVQGVLNARIDRLPETHKHVLQTASVLGREFSSRLLESIWEGSGSLDEILAELKRLEFLYERTGTEESLYVFKHALTQDVAYESLLTTRRQVLHAAAGEVLESLYEDRLEDAYDHLAYHYAKTDNTSKAVEYLTLVAKKAAGGHAHAEAFTTLEQALVHAEQLPVGRDYHVLELAIRQGEALFMMGHRKKLLTLLLGYQERLERLQDASLAGRYYLCLGRVYAFQGSRRDAVASLQRALRESQCSQDKLIMGQAYYTLGSEDYFSGRLLQAVEHNHQGIEVLESIEPSPELAQAYFNLAISYYFMGDFGRALEFGVQSETLSKVAGSRFTQATAIIGWSHVARGDWEEGVNTGQQALRESPQAFNTAFALGILGYAHLEKGELAEATSILEQAVEQATQYRSKQIQSLFRTYLGQAYLATGQIENAFDLAHQGLELAEEVENLWGSGLAQRAIGRIAHTRGDFAESITRLQEAHKTFLSIQARYELARTHLDLASLSYTQNDRDTTTTHLRTAYAWFQKLQVPKWAERTEQLAQEYGVTLIEVELEEDLPEGSS